MQEETRDQGESAWAPEPSTALAGPVHSPTFAAPPPSSRPEPRATYVTLLAGEDAPLPSRGALAVVEGLLKLPANVMHEVRHGASMPWKLTAVVVTTMLVTGLCLAAFSGGLQFLMVPLKLSLGMLACALICLPSLYIFSALSGGGRVSLREAFGALMLGVALTGVLLVGFAPVSWVFSQATDSAGVIGALHLIFFLVSAHFGLRLTRRALAERAGRPVPALALWTFVFLLVVVQMSTTLRPLAGPFEGLALAPKQFFLEHWLS